MGTTWKLTIASLKMFVRNKQAVFFTLFMPFVIMLIFGMLNFDQAPTVNLGIVVANPNEATKGLITQLEEMHYDEETPIFAITQGSETDERTAIEAGDRDLVLLLSDDFIPSSPTADPRTATLIVNQASQFGASTGQSILNQVLSEMSFQFSGAERLFVLEQEVVEGDSFSYIAFLLPGIVAIAIMQMAVFSVSFVFVDYKEKGILKRLLATPMQPSQFVTANVITRLLVALVQTFILIIVGAWLFSIEIMGAWWLILLIAILGAVMFLGLGFTISGFAKTVESVPAVANLIVFPQFFLAETFFPAENFPEWLSAITQYLPLTYFSISLRAVMSEGVGFADVGGDLLWMVGWSVLLVGLAIFTFSFEEKKVG